MAEYNGEIIVPGRAYRREETWATIKAHNFDGRRGEKITPAFNSESFREAEVEWYEDDKIIPKGTPLWNRLESQFNQ